MTTTKDLLFATREIYHSPKQPKHTETRHAEALYIIAAAAPPPSKLNHLFRSAGDSIRLQCNMHVNKNGIFVCALEHNKLLLRGGWLQAGGWRLEAQIFDRVR